MDVGRPTASAPLSHPPGQMVMGRYPPDGDDRRTPGRSPRDIAATYAGGVTEAAIDRVLTAAPPTFTEDEAAHLARELFGVSGAAVAVASERDQTFLIDGDRPAVLKISNAAEDPAQLDLEALAAQRVAQVDPELPGRAAVARAGRAARHRTTRPRTGRRPRDRMARTTPGCTTGCRVGRRCAARA